jgi:Flp pilus assembly protein TadD
LFIDQSLYNWKLSELHAAVCHYVGRFDEAKSSYQDVMSLVKSNPEQFTEADLKKIESNSKFFTK